MRRGLLIVLCAAVLLAHARPATAGASTKPKGHGIAIFTTSYYWADTRFRDSFGSGTRDFSNDGRFDKLSENLWLEYGLTDDLNLLAQVDFGRLVYEDNNGTIGNDGFGNPSLALKYRFAKADHSGETSWAIQGRVKFPVEQDEEPATGYYRTEAELKLLTSRNSKLFGHPIWVSSDVGYRWRWGGGSDEARVGYGVGSGFGRWLVLFDVDGDFGVGNQDDELAELNPQLARDSDRVTVQASVARRLTERFWVQLGGALDVAGRGTGQGKEYKLGIWYTF